MSYRRTNGLGALDAQIVPSQYTGPVGGFACNVAGGYSLVTPKGYMSAQCMTPDQLAQANAAFDAAPAPVTYVAPSSGPAAAVPAQTSPAVGGSQQNGVAVNNMGVSPIGGIVSTPAGTDLASSALAWIQANPWMAAAIAGGVLLVVKG